MKYKYMLFAFLFLVSAAAVFFLLAKPRVKQTGFTNPLASTLSKETSSSASLVYANKKRIEKELNILILGLDGRKGDKNPRCDAIHFFTYNRDEKKITVTSIPRGTTVDLENVASPSAYLGNVCHILGIEKAIGRIEKIAGIHPDFTVKVGFSQVLGIMRVLKLPTTPLLQFLRNRRFGIGDFQRSHNQAVFIKDMIVNYAEKFDKLPRPVKYLIFRMTDTDMPFDTADVLLAQILEEKVYKDPDLIILLNKPSPFKYIKEMHFSPEEFENPSSWQNDGEFKTYQTDLENYLQNLIARGDSLIKAKKESQAYKIIKTPFSQQLWLQLEDEDIRNQIHFEMLKIYALSSPDKTQSSSLILDFITEMESYNQKEFKEKGQALLKEIQ